MSDNRVVIHCLGVARGRGPGPAGQYLKAYHPDSGFSEWTFDVEEALHFASEEQAIEVYRSVLPSQPVRPWDGRPNRPLTAFTVEIGTVDGVQGRS